MIYLPINYKRRLENTGTIHELDPLYEDLYQKEKTIGCDN